MVFPYSIIRYDEHGFIHIYSPLTTDGGAGRERSANLRDAIAALCQLSYDPEMVEATGVRPATVCLQGSLASTEHAPPYLR